MAIRPTRPRKPVDREQWVSFAIATLALVAALIVAFVAV
jgi:hypothetical protein